jgi:quinol monooxygenase YgiN
MATDDTCCTVVPYFTIHEGQHAAVRAMCERFIQLTRSEPKCLYYGFSFNGDQVHCREGYQDGNGVLAHLQNVGALFGEFMSLADLTRIEVHGPAAELEKLKQPLADFKPQFFTLECGFRR